MAWEMQGCWSGGRSMWQMREGDLKGFGCQTQVSALDMGGLEDHRLCPQPGWGWGEGLPNAHGHGGGI